MAALVEHGQKQTGEAAEEAFWEAGLMLVTIQILLLDGVTKSTPSYASLMPLLWTATGCYSVPAVFTLKSI